MMPSMNRGLRASVVLAGLHLGKYNADLRMGVPDDFICRLRRSDWIHGEIKSVGFLGV
jgi:hypothetical protein